MTAAAGSRPAVAERALWIGEPSHPLCLRLHYPESGEVRGMVLLCPPLAREANVTHPTFRQLAEELAMAGLVAARLDYEGMGDSAGSQDDPGRVEAWLASVRLAASALRGCADVPLMVVGMRMGGLLAALGLAGRPEAPEVLCLWDPCPTGRSWLREQRALLLIGAGSSGFGAVPTPGDEAELAAASLGRDHVVDIPSFAYARDEATAIEALSFAQARGRMADRVIVFARPDRPLAAASTARLEEENVEWRTAEGQAELLVIAADYAVVPVTTLRAVVSTLSAAALDGGRPLTLPATESATFSQQNRVGDWRSVVETHVRLGPTRLVGVISRPETALPGSPLVILLGNANEPHTGPSRAWVELARSWAAEGLSTLRVCLSGLGDSPVRPGQSPQVIYAHEALDDVGDIIEATRDPDALGGVPNVVLVGLCSGGYEAMEAALAFGARGVCAVGVIPGAGRPNNLLLDTSTPEPVRTGIDSRRAAAVPVKGWLRRAAQSRRAWQVAERIPQFIWTICDLVNIVPSPARPLVKLSKADIDTLFVVGTRDLRPYRVLAGAKIRKLERQGRLSMRWVPALDHGMLRAGPREEALRLLDTHIRDSFLSGSAGPAQVDVPPAHARPR